MEPNARRCGDCQLCCRLLPAPTLQKSANVKCRHQKYGIGCAIFRHPSRPPPCTSWSCAWVSDPKIELHRPDRVGYFIDPTPDFVVIGTGRYPAIQVWADPRRPDVHRDAMLRAYLAQMAKERGAVAIIRLGMDAIVLIVPSMAESGEWQELPTVIMPSHLKEKIAGA